MSHQPEIGKWFFVKPARTGLVVFLVLAMLGSYLTRLRYQVLRNDEQQAALNVVESAKSRLQQSLQYSFAATQALALSINGNELPDNLDSIAASILSVNKYIDALQLVPDGVIRFVYPLKDNEEAIGYNILADSTRNKEAYKAARERKLYFAGPFELKQGGLAVVGRLPVFIGNKFWGFSAAIIRMPTLLAAAGIDSTGITGYYFQLSKKNPDTGIEEFFLPVQKQSARKLETTVPVPDGEWKLSVIPVKKYRLLSGILPTALLSLALAVLGGFFITYAIKKPAQLQQLVQQRTAELDKSEKRNRAIVNALPDLLFVIDSENRFADYHNPATDKEYIKPIQLIGKKLEEVLPPELAREVELNKAKAIQSQQLITHSYQLQTALGLRDFEARYVKHGKDDVLLLVRDITEAKQAELQLKESEEKYRTLVEQASDGIFISNFSGIFLVVNPAACKMSQYSEEELLKLKLSDLTLSEELQVMPFKFDELKAGKTAYSERKMRRKDGTLIDIEIIARVIGPDRFLAFARDITDRKKVQRELIRSREELRQLTNHLENIREEERLNIAREIHDELGQQLTILKMDVARLGKRHSEDNESKDQTNRIVDLINDIVKTVRKISYELRPSMLDDLGLVAALEWYSKDFEKRTEIRTFFTTEISELKLPDKTAIGLFRIFQESLTNVARHAKATKVDAALEIENDQLVLTIKDNGKGFDPEANDSRRTLGLLGMKERAFMMRGQYDIKSTPGEGTLIKVVVPVGNEAVLPPD
jgi:PAS domain S-box-containing protein